MNLKKNEETLKLRKHVSFDVQIAYSKIRTMNFGVTLYDCKLLYNDAIVNTTRNSIRNCSRRVNTIRSRFFPCTREEVLNYLNRSVSSDFEDLLK